MTDPLKSLRLAIASHVVHFRHQGRLYAFGPYALEIERWADLFDTVTIVAFCRDEPPPGDCLPFTRSNISIDPQIEAGGDSLGAKIKLALTVPLWIAGLARAFRRADAIQVRCAGNLGLLGGLMGPLFSRRLVAKYAGQWPKNEDEPWSSSLQKSILSSRWWGSPVLVYGEWPDQPPHIVPFFTSLLTSAHMERARIAASRFWDAQPLRVLYTGRLTKLKNVDVVLRAIANNRRDGLNVRLTVVGDGPEEAFLHELAASLGIADSVEFAGGVDHDRVMDYLESNDVLVLASDLEGWPKSIAEAMAFGLVCIGSNRGFVPKMLADNRGLVVPPRDEQALTKTIADIARNPHSYATMRRSAAEWSQRYSLDGLQAAIRELLLRTWQFDPPAAGTAQRVEEGAK